MGEGAPLTVRKAICYLNTISPRSTNFSKNLGYPQRAQPRIFKNLGHPPNSPAKTFQNLGPAQHTSQGIFKTCVPTKLLTQNKAPAKDSSTPGPPPKGPSQGISLKQNIEFFSPQWNLPIVIVLEVKKTYSHSCFFHYFGGRPKWILKSPSTKLKGSPQVFSSEHFLRTGLLGTKNNVRAFWEVSYPHVIFWCYPTYDSKGPRAKKGSPKHLTFQAQAWQLLGVKMGWFFCVFFFVVVLVVTVNESPAHTNYYYYYYY